MKTNVPDRIDEHRASVLLGLPKAQLRRYSQVSGLGYQKNDDHGQKIVFTYKELRWLCRLAEQTSK
jgi:hypothetical protein